MNIQEITPIAKLAVARFRESELDLHGDHGPRHWARVYEIGQTLAAAEGADAVVCGLFAVLHDCCRTNEYRDIGHGRRAMNYAKRLRDDGLLKLTAWQFEQLFIALEGHSGQENKWDCRITVQCCWDSDRLDLMRVCIVPKREFLGTHTARQASFIVQHSERASRGDVPEIVLEWLSMSNKLESVS